MKSAVKSVGFLILAGIFASQSAQAQTPPYLLPYTIQSLAGGGTTPTVGSTCVGTNGIVGTAYDAFGDGCPITSGSVIVGPNNNIHDVVVDQQGNIFFIDDTGSNGTVRRIDARTGIVTMYAGSLTVQTPECTATTVYDKYGDGCPANDGKANATGGYTGNFAIFRGLGIGPSGDVFIADYGAYLIHKISRATGYMTVVAGALASGTKATSIGGSKGYGSDNVVAFGQPVAPALTPSAQSAMLSPRGVTVDSAGNIYVADSGNNTIRKIAAGTGIITTIVGANPGNGSAAAAAPAPTTAAPAALPYMADGDGGPATAALLNVPEDVEVDSFGNLFIADMSIARVRVVYAGGAAVASLIGKTNNGTVPVVGDIYTVAGSGIVMNGATGPTTTNAGPVLATSVIIGAPRKLRLDTHGNIYIADNGNNVVWFVDASTGYMRVIAGTLGATTPTSLCAAHTDAFGDNCPATTAALNPNADMGVTVDSLGNILVTDPLDSRLRRVNTNQVFPATTLSAPVAQTLQVHFAVGDSPAAVNPYTINGGTDFAVTPGACTTNPDTTKDCLITVTFTPTVTGPDTASLTVASTLNGSSLIGLSGTGTAAALAFDPGSASTFSTGLNASLGIAVDPFGNTYVADTGNNRVLRYAAGGGTPTVIAGTGTSGYTGDGAAATAATLSAPAAVTVTRTGAVYIADTGNNAIRLIDPVTKFISTVGGGASPTVCTLATDAFGDGCPATSAKFSKPAGLASDSDGNVYVSDSGNNLIREISVTGYAFLVGGGGTVCSVGDTYGNGCLATQATFKNPTALALDLGRSLYVADTGNNYIRKISGTGVVSAVAGNGQPGSSGNNGLATSAQLNGPTGLAVDAAANLYIADTGNAVVRLVNTAGNISTVAGILGVPGTGTLPGSAFTVQLASPGGVASNGAGLITILDSGNNRAILDNRDTVSYYFGRVNPGSSSAVASIQESSTGDSAATLSAGAPLFTASGANPTSFSVTASGTGGCSSGQVLTAGSSCLLSAQFSPATTGQFAATFTEASATAINSPAPALQLTGTGAVLTPTNSVTTVTAGGPPQFGIPFTVTTTVTPTSCNPVAGYCVPTGTVSFSVDGNGVGTPVTLSATGTASAPINGLSVGPHTITTSYTGDLYYGPSTSTLIVNVAQGTTTTTVSASPSTIVQFNAITLIATVTTKTGAIATGTVAFYAAGNSTPLGTANINPTTGVATLSDTLVGATNTTPAYYANYGLNAGTYAITAVYTSSNTNYATSTSAPYSLVIGPQASSFSVTLSSTSVGTAQGSSSNILATIVPSNTLSGTITFSCANMPANSDCTFQPTTLTFTPVAGVPTDQEVNVTLFTDVPSAVLPTAAQLLGWPVLLLSLFSMIAFRKRMRAARLLAVLALFGILTGGSIVLSGCTTASISGTPTPVGTYTINFTAKGPSNTITTPVTFIVGAGAPGQL